MKRVLLASSDKKELEAAPASLRRLSVSSALNHKYHLSHKSSPQNKHRKDLLDPRHVMPNAPLDSWKPCTCLQKAAVIECCLLNEMELQELFETQLMHPLREDPPAQELLGRCSGSILKLFYKEVFICQSSFL